MPNFVKRTSKPGTKNKSYICTDNGGWNTCVHGNPQDKYLTALANCVGYASGRANEVANEINKTTGCKYKRLNCNAEGFLKRAKEYGWTVSMTPRAGSIMCWEGLGSLAGHVAFVESVLDATNKVYTSESSWGGKAFFNSIRTNDNARWGMSKNYRFSGFLYVPEVVVEQITPVVARNTLVDQLKLNKDMNVRLGIETSSESIGIAKSGSIFNYYEVKQGKSSKWYAITPDKTQWVAGINNNGTKYCDIYPKQQPVAAQPIKKFKVGDIVVPIKPVSYKGVKLKQWDKWYKITELHGDKATLSARGQIWATLNTNNIKYYKK